MIPSTRHDRRAFLATLVSLAAGGLAASVAGCVARPPREGAARDWTRNPGIQLYTVRDLLARDFPGTLERLRDIGYREVELAGLHGHSARTVRGWLDALGMRAPAAHVPLESIRDDWARVLDDARTLGHGWILLPWLDPRDRTTEGMTRIAALLDARGAAARAEGIRLAYHTHDFAFTGSSPLVDTLLHATDPALVDIELDVYWAVVAGVDPVRWLARHPGRCALLHMKDSGGAPAHRMLDVGAGTIDFGAILAQAAATGRVAHAFVEHDEPADPLRSAAASWQALAKRGGRAAR